MSMQRDAADERSGFYKGLATAHGLRKWLEQKYGLGEMVGVKRPACLNSSSQDLSSAEPQSLHFGLIAADIARTSTKGRCRGASASGIAMARHCG